MSDRNEIIDVEAVEIEDSDNLPAVIEHEASNSETIELPNRQDTLLADNPERRCAAHKRNGERCRKFAIEQSSIPVDQDPYAASVPVVSSGRSMSLPFSNVAPARTSATRCGALTARQRD